MCVCACVRIKYKNGRRVHGKRDKVDERKDQTEFCKKKNEKEKQRSSERVRDGNDEGSDSKNDKTKTILTQLIFDGIAYAQMFLWNMIACEHLAFTTSHSSHAISLLLCLSHGHMVMLALSVPTVLITFHYACAYNLVASVQCIYPVPCGPHSYVKCI